MLSKQLAEILLSIYSDKELSTEKKIELATVILDKNTTTQINHFYPQSYQTQPWDLPIYPNYPWDSPVWCGDNGSATIDVSGCNVPQTYSNGNNPNQNWEFNFSGARDLKDPKDKKD